MEKEEKRTIEKIDRKLLEWEKSFKDNNWDYIVIILFAWGTFYWAFQAKGIGIENTTVLVLTICAWGTILWKIIKSIIRAIRKSIKK